MAESGVTGNFYSKERNDGMVGQRPIFRPGIPSGFKATPIFCSPRSPFGGSPLFGSSISDNFGSSKAFYGRFQGKNFKRKFPPQGNEARVVEIDLTKPWVTEEIKTQETEKLNLLSIWRMSKNDENWNKYKIQKMKVQSSYENAKAQYIISHPNEDALWNTTVYYKKLYCETCDKSFRIDDDLIRHESDHETCGRDGCNFTAHPKIISKHIKMQHDSGLYRRIGVLYTKEDIAKWLEERKKRYPTRKVIEEKKEMEEEKVNRGERIKDSDSRFNKSFTNRYKSDVKKKFEEKTKNKNRRQKKKKKKPLIISVEEDNLLNEKRDVAAFHGIKNHCELKLNEKEDKKDNLNISDDEWETEIKQNILKPVLNNSLSLLSTYDSEEEEESHNSKCAQEKYVSDNEGSGPEEVATVHKKSPPSEDIKLRKIPVKKKLLGKNLRQCKRIKNNFNERNSENRSLTLLEKLLKNEIKHERNVVLQCVHYIVKNNFFKK